MATLHAAFATGAPLIGGDLEANVASDHHEAAADDDNGAAGSFSWLTLLGFLFLTFNSAMAIVRSRGDATAIAFVALFTYVDLVVALFICLRMFERAPAGSSRRGCLKAAVWTLTALLTFAFSSKVTAVMPPPVAALVWLMAFATVAGGFVAFFVCKEKKREERVQGRRRPGHSVMPLTVRRRGAD